jgi:hypothetical protein
VSHQIASSHGAVALSFVDDVTWIVEGADDAEVTVKLNKCAATCLTWAQDNAVRFEEDKTEAILFSRRREHQRGSEEAVVVGNHAAPFNEQAIRWLGFWLDPKLTLNHHHQKWLAKAKQQQARISRLCRRQGLPPGSAANLQKAVVQSVATYGIELNATRRQPSRDVGRMANLQKILNQQARAATGCFRTTPVGFLMAEGGSRPAEAIVRGHEARFRTRILGRPPPHPDSSEQSLCHGGNHPAPSHTDGRLVRRDKGGAHDPTAVHQTPGQHDYDRAGDGSRSHGAAMGDAGR